MNRDDECPIWGTLATFAPTIGDFSEVQSARAGGAYTISGSAKSLVGQSTQPEKVKLTSWLVEQRRHSGPCPKISGDTLAEIANRRAPSVHERADCLLRYLAASSALIGSAVTFNTKGDPQQSKTLWEAFAWTSSSKAEEVVTLIEYCAEEKWITHCKPSGSEFATYGQHQVMLRPPGYARLAALDGINTSSRQGFVAMWFHPDMDDAYNNGLKLAIEDAGYEPLRIDNVEHNNKIDDEIIAEIRRSRFVVADFTQEGDVARGGVYYEAGFAHGLNIPVIFTCHEGALEKVHFDTRQYNHIVWKDAEDLRERLQQRISATIGDGPLKKPT